MPLPFTLAKILPPEAARITAEASGGDILTNVKAANVALCRPAGWIAHWRKIGTLSILNRQTHFIA